MRVFFHCQPCMMLFILFVNKEMITSNPVTVTKKHVKTAKTCQIFTLPPVKRYFSRVDTRIPLFFNAWQLFCRAWFNGNKATVFVIPTVDNLIPKLCFVPVNDFRPWRFFGFLHVGNVHRSGRNQNQDKGKNQKNHGHL